MVLEYTSVNIPDFSFKFQISFKGSLRVSVMLYSLGVILPLTCISWKLTAALATKNLSDLTVPFNFTDMSISHKILLHV